MKEISIKSNKRNEMIDITDKLRKIIIEEKIVDGFLIAYVPHTTAGITINEGADPSVKEDIINFLNDIIPQKRKFIHLEGNSDAHIKASIIGSSITLIIRKKQLALGTWQHVFFFDADGPRNRKLFISLINNS
jgi:secondary thiamine-phosphate synthase enzyme